MLLLGHVEIGEYVRTEILAVRKCFESEFSTDIAPRSHKKEQEKEEMQLPMQHKPVQI